MPILKPRISEDKRLGSYNPGMANVPETLVLGNLNPSLLFSEIQNLKRVHDDKHRWDYLKGRYPYTCQDSWILCNCSCAIFIRGAEMGISQARIRIFEEII